MTYKTILVHAGLDTGADERMRCAARLARGAGAHLVGAAATGISPFLTEETVAAGGPAVAHRCAALRAGAAQALRQFDRIARAEGVASAEARFLDDDVAAALALHARYADLVVIGQCGRGRVHPPLPDDLPDTLVQACCRPVLHVPAVAPAVVLDGLALVAWDGGVACVHALDRALPLLRQAARVVVLRRGPPPDRAAAGDAYLAGWFGRHGIAAHIVHQPDTGRTGDAILAQAEAYDATLLVMGAYGHARWRETLLDGATATVLGAAQLPVLLAH